MLKSILCTFILLYFCSFISAQPYLEWESRHNGPTENDQGNVITTDDAGNVYVAGKSVGTASADYLTIKYNGKGDTLWTARYNGAADGEDEVLSIDVDDDGNVYITGKSLGINDGYNIVTIKYNAQGQEQWKHSFNGSANMDDIGNDLVVDIFGNVYVCGSAGSNSAGVVIKLSSNGSLVWFVYQLRRNTNVIKINSFGNLVCSSGSSFLSVNYLIYELNSLNGAIIYTYNNTFPGINGFPEDFVLDAVGNIYVLSTYASFLTPNRLYVAKFNRGFTNNSYNIPYFTSGTIRGKSLKIDKNSNLYLVADIYITFHRYLIRKIDFSGNIVWTSTYNSKVGLDDIPASLALSSSEQNPDIYISGYTSAGNIITVKYSNSGDTLWTQVYDCGNNGPDASHAMVMDKCDNIYITGYSICDNTFRDIKTLKYSTLLKPIIKTSKQNPICSGDAVVLSVDTCTNCAYLWSDGSTSDSILVSPESNTQYYITLTNSTGCEVVSLPYTVNVIQRLSPSINVTSNDTEICLGESVVFNAVPVNGGPGVLYRWYVNGVLQNVPSSPSLTISPTDDAQVSCIMTTSVQCYTQLEATSNTVNILVHPLPSVNIIPSGPTSFCQGDSVVLNANNNNGTFLWSNNSTANSIKIYQSGDYKYTFTDVNGCSNVSQSVSVKVNTLPIPIITPNGNTSFCEGGSVNLQTSDFTQYLWSNGATTANINVNFSGSFTVTVVNSNGCSGASTPINVSVNDNLLVEILHAGDNNLCLGEAITLQSSVSGSSYSWNNNANTSSINVTSAGIYQLSVTDSNGCTGISDPLVINVLPLPEVFIDTIGNTSFCQGESVTLVANDAVDYVWSNGAKTKQIVVSETGNYTVTITDINNCKNSSFPVGITVYVLPPVGLTHTGNVIVCEGDTLNVSVNPGYTYLWNTGINTNVIDITEAGPYWVAVTDDNDCINTSDTLMVTVATVPNVQISADAETVICEGDMVQLSATNANSYLWNTGETNSSIFVSNLGYYFVKGTNDSGCFAFSDSLFIEVLTRLEPKVDINASAISICEGQSVTFVSQTTNGGPNPEYQWFVNGTDQNVADPTFSSATFTNGDNVYCRMTSNEKCLTKLFDNSNSITLAVNENVTPSIKIINVPDPITTCKEYVLDIETKNEGNSAKYKWFINNGLVAETRQITYADFRIGDIIYCQLESSLTCVTEKIVHSDTIALNIVPLSVPVVSQKNDTIFALNYNSSEYVYSWFYNGNQVSNEPYILCTQNGSGSYYLEVSIDDCTIASSTIEIVCLVNTDNLANENSIHIYPNPTNNILNISGKHITNNIITMQLYNMMGQKLKDINVATISSNINYQLDMTNLVEGIYLLTLNRDNIKTMYKVYKIAH